MESRSVTEFSPFFAVLVTPSGMRFDARADQSLLVSALGGGVNLPSSCRNGTCRACLCSLSSGRVRYLIEWPGLSAEEKQQGYILPCVAVPESALTLEAPSASPGLLPPSVF